MIDDNNQLLEILVFANTPSYLYRHFRRNASVIRIARENDTSVLIARLDETLKEEIDAPEKYVEAFALLIALSMKPYSEVKSFLERKVLPNLDWSAEILGIINSEIVVFQYSSLIKEKPALNKEKPIMKLKESWTDD